jgi:hypothetical protein
MGAWLTLAAGSHYIRKWRQLADSAHATIAMDRGLQEIIEARRGHDPLWPSSASACALCDIEQKFSIKYTLCEDKG